MGPGVTSSSSMVYSSFRAGFDGAYASIVLDASEPVISSNLYRASGVQSKEAKTLSYVSPIFSEAICSSPE